MPKIKIQRTNRICIASPMATIYCSSKITGDKVLRPLLQRLGQKLFPLKGENDAVKHRLRELARVLPDHFPESSKLALQGTLIFEGKFGS